MRALKVPLHALWTEHAAVERELFPGFEANDHVISNLELDPALLAAKAAVRLHQALGFCAGREAHARHLGQVRAKALDDLQLTDR
jgi:hypothetical protein